MQFQMILKIISLGNCSFILQGRALGGVSSASVVSL